MTVDLRFTPDNPFAGNQYSLVSLFLETLVLSNFISNNITVFFIGSIEKTDVGLEVHGMEQNLSILVNKSKLQNVMPLVIPSECCPPEQRTRCDAKIRCRVAYDTDSQVTCKNCLWQYHPHCIGGGNEIRDDCGCSDIPTKSER